MSHKLVSFIASAFVFFSIVVSMQNSNAQSEYQLKKHCEGGQVQHWKKAGFCGDAPSETKAQSIPADWTLCSESLALTLGNSNFVVPHVPDLLHLGGSVENWMADSPKRLSNNNDVLIALGLNQVLPCGPR